MSIFKDRCIKKIAKNTAFFFYKVLSCYCIIVVSCMSEHCQWSDDRKIPEIAVTDLCS